LLSKNQFLGPQDFLDLYAMAGHYLQHACNQAQAARCLAICSKIEKLSINDSQSERLELEKQLAEEFTARRIYEPNNTLHT
jgi:hypothetical protein